MEQKTKFNIQDMLPIGITLVVVGIAIAYGLEVQGDVLEDELADQTLSATCNTSFNGGTGNVRTGCGSVANATQSGIDGVAKLPEKMTTIASVVVAAIVIGVLVRYLGTR